MKMNNLVFLSKNNFKKVVYLFFSIYILFFAVGCTRNDINFEQDSSPLDDSLQYQTTAPWDVEFFDSLYAKAPNVAITEDVRGGIVPHHLLAGKYIAGFFEVLKKQKPSIVVIIGPDHFSRGRGKISTTKRDWKTPFGVVYTDTKLLNKLQKLTHVTVDEEMIAEEHSVYGIVPFVARSLPKTKVLTLALRNDLTSKEIKDFVDNLDKSLPKDAVVISSIDFSHYQPLVVSDYHDELSRAVIESFDYDRLSNLEIDSIPSLEAIMRYVELRGAQKISTSFHDNSARIVGSLDAQDTTSYFIPFFVDGPKKDRRVASMLHFGDIMLDRNVAKAMGGEGVPYLLDKLAGEEGRFFQGVDIVTANLEGPFADTRRQTSKEIAFRFDPILIPQLQKYGFNLFTVANNHTVDMGYEGDRESRRHLQEAGIDFFGHQYSVEDDSYLLKEVGGVKLAFVGVNDTHPNTNILKVIELIKKGEAEADVVIIDIHWGDEYKIRSNLRQQSLAKQFIDAGADLIIGNHPHNVEEIGVYKDRPIFYSLGNFIFDQYFSVATQEGLGVGFIFEKKDTEVEIRAYLFPLQGEKSVVRLKTPEERKLFVRTYFDEEVLSPYTKDNSYFSFTF